MTVSNNFSRDSLQNFFLIPPFTHYKFSLSLSFSFTLNPFSPFSSLSNLNQFSFKLQHNRTRLCFQKGKRICSTLKSKFRRPRKIIDNFLSPSFQNLDQLAADTNGCSYKLEKSFGTLREGRPRSVKEFIRLQMTG